jgi:hypothetical protein
VRLQLHALAYNLGNFMRTLAMPKTVETWSMTSLREKLIKIGAKMPGAPFLLFPASLVLKPECMVFSEDDSVE